jgi:hypothetical protein
MSHCNALTAYRQLRSFPNIDPEGGKRRSRNVGFELDFELDWYSEEMNTYRMLLSLKLQVSLPSLQSNCVWNYRCFCLPCRVTELETTSVSAFPAEYLCLKLQVFLLSLQSNWAWNYRRFCLPCRVTVWNYRCFCLPCRVTVPETTNVSAFPAEYLSLKLQAFLPSLQSNWGWNYRRLCLLCRVPSMRWIWTHIYFDLYTLYITEAIAFWTEVRICVYVCECLNEFTCT